MDHDDAIGRGDVLEHGCSAGVAVGEDEQSARAVEFTGADGQRASTDAARDIERGHRRY